MSAPTKGGVTIKVLGGRAAPGLQRYRDSKDETKESYLFATTRHCSMDVDRQIAEWKAVRAEHGTDGARRTSRATLEKVDPETGLHANGQRGTHVEYWDERSQRKRKRPVRQGEMPTHLRIESGDLTVRESEAHHTIVAFGPDLINPDDHEALERGWQAVTAWRDERYPGLQESMWMERNGESGLAHVHIASNATIYQDFTLDGVDYKAGRKMSGALTRVDAVRADFEQWLDAHPEYSMQQSLARVGTREYEAAQRRDGQLSYWEDRRGKESSQDRIRREVYEALQTDGVTDRATFVDEMQSRGITVSETGLRRGKRSSRYDLLYTVEGSKQGVKGKTLGAEYAHDVIDAQLARAAAGQEIELPAGRQRAGEMRPLPLAGEELTAREQAELERLKTAVGRAAETERQYQAADLWEAERAERDAQAREALQQQIDEQQSQMERQLSESGARREAKVAEMLAQRGDMVEQIRDDIAERSAAFQQEQAAREAERRAILDNPPASLAGLSDEELAQRVDRQVVVSYDFVSGGPTRMADRERMARQHGLTREEIAYLDEVWWDRDRPETASERSEQEQVETLDQTDDSPAPEPVTDPEAVQVRQLDEQEHPAEVQSAAEQLAVTAEQPQEAEEVEEQDEIDSELETEDSGELEQEQAEVEQSEHSEARVEAQQPEATQQAAEQETSHVEDAEPAFRSRLRDVDLSGRTELTRQKAAGLAQLEEDYHGRQPDAEFERRIADRDGEIAGLGPKALEVFSPYLSDEMRGHLESRLSHQRATQTAWEKGEEHRERAERIERTDPLGLRSDELYEERWQAGFQSRRVDRLRQEQTQGIYDQETPAAQAEAAEVRQHVIDRGSRVETSERRTRLEQSMSSLERDVAAAHSRDQGQDDELERG